MMTPVAASRLVGVGLASVVWYVTRPSVLLGQQDTGGAAPGSGPVGSSWPAHAARLVLILVTYILATNKTYDYWLQYKSHRAGCGPAPWYPHLDPLLGLDFMFGVLAAYRRNRVLETYAAMFSDLGDTFWVNDSGSPMLMTRAPENIKAILATNFRTWPMAGMRLTAVRRLFGDESVFSSNGDVWHAARASVRPSFVRDQIADLAAMDRHVAKLVARIPKDGSEVDMQDLFLKYASDTGTEFLIGASLDMLGNPTPEALAFDFAMGDCTYRVARSLRLGGVFNLMGDKVLDDEINLMRDFVMRHVVAARELAARSDRKDELATSAYNEKRRYVLLYEMLRSGASDGYVRDQLVATMSAARDTTATSLAVLLFTLARHPEVVQKLRREIEEFGVPNPTWEQLKELKYLQMVVKESQRLHTTVPTMTRGCNEDTTLPVGGGPDGRSPVFCPKGTIVRWSMWCVHRRPDIFGPDADEFRPERWEGVRHGWEYLPFSGGPRVCVGQQFALTQITFTLFRLLQAFEAIEPCDPRPLEAKVSQVLSIANGCRVAMIPVGTRAKREEAV